MSDADVRLDDGTRARLTVTAGPGVTVLTAGSLSAVQFGVTRNTSTVVEAPGGVAYTSAGLGNSSTDAGGTGGLGEVIGGSIRYEQRTAAAVWTFTHPLGRIPQVSTYVSDPPGAPLEEVDTSVTATDTQVIVEWPRPMSGELIVQ